MIPRESRHPGGQFQHSTSHVGPKRVDAVAAFRSVGAAATGEEVVLAALDEGDLDEGDEEGVLLELVELVPSHLRSPLENLS